MKDLNSGIKYTILPKNNFNFGFKELWSYRELFFFFSWRDIKVKYKQTVFGIVWAIIQPLALMAIFTLIFQRGLKLQSDNLPYPVFVFTGLLIWNIFGNGLSSSATSMVNNANIIKKIYFPRLIIPVSSIFSVVFDFLFSLIVFICLLLYFKIKLSFFLFFIALPLGLFLTIITTLGIGAFLSALNVKYRDFQYAVPFLIQFLLFVNPVLYSSKSITNPFLNQVMRLNPIANSINLIRSSLSGNQVNWTEFMFSLLVSLAFLFIGLFTFRKTEAYFADLA